MRIVVLAGGLSMERNVSLSSGTRICRALRERGHQAVLVDMFLGLEGYAGAPESIFDAPDGLCGEFSVAREEPDLDAVRASRKDKSENIFGKDVRRKVYISSADFMTRNTCRRIEIAAPLLDEDAKERAVSIFETQLADNVKAREQQPNGEYMYIKTDLPRMDAQRFLYSQAYSAEPKQDEKAEQTKTGPKKKRSIFARIADFFRRKKRG